MKDRVYKKNIFGVLLLATLLYGCGGEMSKFDWLASESAPKGYPMQIISGSFYDKHGDAYIIPGRKKIHDGWGTEVSIHVVGEEKKSLPIRLDILYFSYAENSFFEGTFELPERQILNLFKAGYYSPKSDDQVTYRMIVVGVAPGGRVSVWLKGIDKTTDVFSGVAEKTEIPWENVAKTKQFSREGYISVILEEAIGQEGIAKIKQEGISFGVWEKYRKLYDWKPIVTGVAMPKVLNNFSFFNGEKDYFSKFYDNDWSNELKAIPSSMQFTWKHEKNNAYSLEVQFDEDEIFEAFEAITVKSSKPIEFNIDISQVKDVLYYRFFLRSDNEVIELTNGNFEHYRSAMTGNRLEKFLKEN